MRELPVQAIYAPDKGSDARFVRNYLTMPAPARFIAVNTLGVAVQGINLRDVRCIPVANPPIGEAKEISDRIDGSSKRMEEELLSLQKMKLSKAGLMDDLLSGRVRVTPLLEATAL